MKEYIFCTRMAPALTISDDSCIGRMITMENVRVMECGYFALVYSSLKSDEWEWIRMHFPELLRITDDRGQETFSIGFAPEGPGSVEPDQVIFGNMQSGDHYPTVTLMLDSDLPDDERASILLDRLGEGLNRLAEVEQMALTVLRRKEDRTRTIRNRIIRL